MNIFIALIVGGISGAVAALCGVGGGIVMVPAFVYLLKLPMHQAVATSLAVIIPTAIVATFKNQGNSLIHWPTVIAAGIGAAVVAWFMADLLVKLRAETLTKVFAVLMIVVGVRMLFSK